MKLFIKNGSILFFFAFSVLNIPWVQAELLSYTIDPEHTYPSFEADHFGGMSVWRGKFRHTSGTIELDRANQNGTINVIVNTASIDFGLEAMNQHARSADIFDVDKFPTAIFIAKLTRFEKNAPKEASGLLTLHGITKPITLQINTFLCKQNPMKRREVCGADAEANINRADFGITAGQKSGFKMDVKILIQIEAIKN